MFCLPSRWLIFEHDSVHVPRIVIYSSLGAYPVNFRNDDLTKMFRKKQVRKTIIDGGGVGKPSTNARKNRNKRNLSAVVGQGFGEKAVNWEVRDGKRREIQVIINSANPYR